MHNLMALARVGHNVVISNGNSVNATSLAKEVVTFETTNEEEANHWVAQMIEAGYSVEIDYNEKTGVWKCIAYR